MKNLFLFLMLAGFLGSCNTGPTLTETEESKYHPLLMTRDQLRASVVFQPRREMNRPGKIYTKDKYLFISEQFKGVHFINNEDPSNPQQVGFLRVPGCIDMAVKDNTLFVDNAVDLVSVDISDINNPVVTNRVEDVFPEHTPPDGGVLEKKYNSKNRPEGSIIVDWIKM